jgi:hypothetical protein
MSIELEAILASNLSTMVFIYGSAIMLVGSMLAVSLLTGKSAWTRQPSLVRSYP